MEMARIKSEVKKKKLSSLKLNAFNALNTFCFYDEFSYVFHMKIHHLKVVSKLP